MAYIIKSYNKYDRWDREHATHVFSINDVPYAVMKVGMEWGLPQIPSPMEYEDNPGIYHIYDTEEQAMEFVHLMHSLN